MKPNRFRDMIVEGRVPVGHMLMEFDTRGVARMLETAGVDFAFVDMEHGSFSTAQAADMIAWLRGSNVTPFVRIPEIQYHFIARALDAGAMGIMAPHVDTRAVVNAAKYPPLGERGLVLNGANSDFRPVNAQEFTAYVNENTTVICLIESPEALRNLEDIAATPGVDVLWLGYADLALSMGIPGQYHDDRFLAALRLMVDTAKKHGLLSGIQPGNPVQAQEWLPLGFDVVSYGVDFSVYVDALKQAVSAVRSLAANR
jgi:2-keto-3-deoxy-L-rhamnonate aldolase RhmA